MASEVTGSAQHATRCEHLTPTAIAAASADDNRRLQIAHIFARKLRGTDDNERCGVGHDAVAGRGDMRESEERIYGVCGESRNIDAGCEGM